MKNRIQRLGKFLSKMILSNISAFIVWGFLTALFIADGWLPNPEFQMLIDPMTKYLLPLLIGYTGGTLVYEKRGGVIGAVATMGVIVGTDIPMFAGAMIMGPLGGYFTKLLDKFVKSFIPSGFEMLVQNFSQGFLGLSLLLINFKIIGPVISFANQLASEGLSVIIRHGLMPVTALIIEPAKILFLNNVINHGVLGPLGFIDTVNSGHSILFLLETNPGPGLGILLAYMVFEKNNRQYATGASIIHFLGGIHEVYFPFVLARPILLLPLILGSMSSIIIFEIFKIGLIATPSPGSIFSLLALAPKGDQMLLLMGVMTSTIITFLSASLLLKPREEASEIAIESHQSIKTIVFACDAGMGSSVMAAKQFQNKLNKNLSIKVDYAPVEYTPLDTDLIIVHEKLVHQLPKGITGQVMPVRDFMNSKQINQLIQSLNQSEEEGEEQVAFFKKKTAILTEKRITTGLSSTEKYDAIRQAGKALLEEGLIETPYIDAMVEREDIATTYIGSNVAIPHGTKAAKSYVKNTGIIIHQYPEGVDFGNGNIAKLVIAIAASGDEHMDILMNIADAVSNQETLDYLIHEKDVAKIYATFVEKGLGGK